ncbi:MAG: osmotically inducible protein OsmC, partial [Elusimicrobia bacterium]|nr:osmotically inducible protein OsmC [Elusimicrobiota bacterium]
MSEMEITFPGGKKVNALWHGFEIATDQPKSSGGDNSAPAPFDLFLASLGTCAGIFVLGF